MKTKLDELRDLMKSAHESINQTRKDGVTPYFNHVADVEDRVTKVYRDLPTNILTSCRAIALMHDFDEDVSVENPAGREDFVTKICELGFGYELDQSLVLACPYTKRNFPFLNRKNRKRLECDRLVGVLPLHPRAYVVKLCDIESNLYDNPTKQWVTEKLDLIQALLYNMRQFGMRCVGEPETAQPRLDHLEFLEHELLATQSK